jgi:hypothetical protein
MLAIVILRKVVLNLGDVVVELRSEVPEEAREFDVTYTSPCMDWLFRHRD